MADTPTKAVRCDGGCGRIVRAVGPQRYLCSTCTSRIMKEQREAAHARAKAAKSGPVPARPRATSGILAHRLAGRGPWDGRAIRR